MKKKKAASSAVAAPSAAEKSKKLKKALSRLGLLLLIFALFITVYEISLIFRFCEMLTLVYYVLAGVGVVAVFLLNRGFNSKPTKKEDLSDEMTDEEKDAYLEEEKRRMGISRVIMYFLLPLIVVIFIDLLDLYFRDLINSFIGKKS
ncbi:MAG: hypothetical protein IKT70_05790 [Clostridia bacterium]|nr:hypothetical protein [Clostridia bacterium]